LATALALLGRWQQSLGRHADARQSCRAALDLAEDLGAVTARTHLTMAYALVSLREPASALDHANTAVAGFRAAGYRRPAQNLELASALHISGVALDSLGRHDEALARGESAVRLLRTLRLVPRMLLFPEAAAHLMPRLGAAGRCREAVDMGSYALDIVDILITVLRRPAMRATRAGIRGIMSHCHVELGELEKALTAADQAVAEYRALGPQQRQNLAWALDIRATALAAMDRGDDARAALEESRSLMSEPLSD
jgi:tetratricopeptide (TPR) repeat protein